jgi:hypothetical protein
MKQVFVFAVAVLALAEPTYAADYGAPLCTGGTIQAPEPPICINQAETGVYAVRAGESLRCGGPADCARVIEAWRKEARQ